MLRRMAPVLALIMMGCGERGPRLVEVPPPKVVVAKPIEQVVFDYAEFNGEVKAVQTNEVRARIRGHLIKVYFEDGAEVKKGDVLFEIDPRPYKAALDQAEAHKAAADAQLKLATAEYNRIKELANKRAASREELEVTFAKQAVSQAELGKATAEVERAQLDMDWTKIHADMDGTISRSYVDVGNLVNVGTTLLTRIVSVDPIYVYFRVDERAVLRAVREEQEEHKSLKELRVPVTLMLPTGEEYQHKGVLDFADTQTDKSTGTNEVRAVIPNPKDELRSGMFVRVRVPMSKPHKALLVDETALGTDQLYRYLLVVNAKNEVERRNVTLGRTHGKLREVAAGLQPDDWVIVTGIQYVLPGMTVDPKQETMPGAPKQEPEPKKPEPKEPEDNLPEKKD